MKKKMLKISVVLMLMLAPALVKNNEVKAEGGPSVGEVANLLDAIHDLFCPDKRMVCKPTGDTKSCVDGACISFRKNCTSDKDCR